LQGNWVPGNLLQLLLGSPSLTGSNSGNSIWLLSCSFSFSAKAKWGWEKLGRVLSLFQDASSTLSAVVQNRGK
jgi:hypothetical protein